MAREIFKSLPEFPESLHTKQEEALELLLEGKDVLGVMPTGFGKSLIYGAFPHILDLVNIFGNVHDIQCCMNPMPC